jgi:hypothetical protein
MLNSISGGAQPTCDPPFDYITLNCKSLNSYGTQVYTWAATNPNVLNCVSCKPYSMTYSPQLSEAVCVPTSRGGMFSSVSPFTAITNCFRYGLTYATSPSLVCMQCSSGYFLTGYFPTLRHKSSTVSCVLGCVTNETPSKNSIFLDDMFGFVNICACTSNPEASPCIVRNNCQIYAKTSHLISKTDGVTGLADWSCILSATGYILSYQNLNSFLNLDTVPSVQTALAQTSYTGHGFSLQETTFRPSTFNFRTPIVVAELIPLAGGNNNVLTNCEVGYKPIENKGTSIFLPNAVQCLRCKFGQYFLTAAASRSSTVYPSCISSGSCQNFKVGGLSSFLSLALSCHVCSWSGGVALYPTIYAEYGKTNTANDNFNIFYQFDVRTTGSKNVFDCAAAINVITSPSDTVLTGSSMSNCGAFSTSLPVEGTTVPNPLTYYNFCIACKTGFYPTYNLPLAAGGNSLPNWAITTCTSVQYCDTTVTIGSFNGCEKCMASTTTSNVATNYAFTDYLLWKCDIAGSPNCFILNWTVSVAQGTPMTCLICKNGFVLNLDNQCEKYTLPNQLSGSSFTNSIFAKFYSENSNPSYDSHYVRIYYLLVYTSSIYGLSNGENNPCSSGYTLSTPSILSPTLCVLSSYLQAQIFPASGSKFVKNCVAYASPSTLIPNFLVLPCVQCTSNFIPTVDNTSCVNSINNCQIAQNTPNTVLCSICNDDFLNSNGVCYSKSINNCISYLNTKDSSSATSILCTSCATGYSLSISSTTCIFGEIKNCASYTVGSTSSCIACNSGFTLLILSSGKNYCYPFLASLNATSLISGTATIDGSNNGTIIPSTCIQTNNSVYGLREFSSISNLGQAQSICMPFTTIGNCLLYDQNSTTITSNSFECVLCKSGFYLNSTGNCVFRTINPTTCSNFSISQDVCIKCQSAYFLNPNGTQCVAFPSGIQGCLIYEGPSRCLQCQEPRYLQNSTCTVSAVIANCEIYSANFTCRKCKSKYFLTNETLCSLVLAENCLSVLSINSCETCPTNFGLKTVGGNINCVSNILPNCANSTKEFPFRCLQCTGNYYPNDSGSCVQTLSTIRNCIVYSSGSICAVCSKNSVLSPDGTICNSTFFASEVDPNCEENYYSTNPSCETCSFGYYFSSGVCIPCTSNSVSSGCYSCDPSNNTICLICSPGFYQNENMTCLRNKNNQPGQGPLPITNTTTTKTSFVETKRIKIILTFFLIFG